MKALLWTALALGSTACRAGQLDGAGFEQDGLANPHPTSELPEARPPGTGPVEREDPVGSFLQRAESTAPVEPRAVPTLPPMDPEVEETLSPPSPLPPDPGSLTSATLPAAEPAVEQELPIPVEAGDVPASEPEAAPETGAPLPAPPTPVAELAPQPPLATTSNPGESAPAPIVGEAAETQGQGDEQRQLEEQLDRARAERDYEAVRRISGRLIALPSLSSARTLHAEGRYEEELEVLKRALELTPEQPDLLLALGEVRLLLAEAPPRGERPAEETERLLRGAREAFLRAGGTPACLLGQSRAARGLGEPREALDCARRALAQLALRREERLSLEPAAEVLLAQAGMDLLHGLRRAEPAAAEELFLELVGALRSRVQEKSTDALAFARLAELYLEVENHHEAEKTAKRGLGASPSDARLHELAARSAAALGGPEEVLRLFRELREQFPNQPLVHWHLAQVYFESSVSGVLLAECENETEQLTKAERWFRRARELDARHGKACLGHEALCRSLAGWRFVSAGRLEEARIAFLSMNDVGPRQIAVDPAELDPRWAGRVQNGIAGLERIAALHREAKNFSAAAEVHALLARESPGDGRQARGAAEAAKEAADTLAEEATLLEQAAAGEVKDPQKLKRLRRWAGVARERDFGTEKERAKFTREAGLRREASAAWFEKCWEYSLRAVELDPLDVRLAADAARVAIRHTRRDLERAESLLSGAVRMAEGRSQQPDLKPDEKNRLLVSWADAEQALGELELDLKDNPTAAVQHFQNSLDVMPGPRPQVSEILLPRARARLLEKDAAAPPGSVPPGNPERRDSR